MAWRWVLSNSAGSPIGEPRAWERSLSLGISKVGTASFRIRADDPLWSQFETGDRYLRVYASNGSLCFYGPIITIEEVGSGQGATIKCNAVDLMWCLGKRFVGKTPGGAGLVFGSPLDPQGLGGDVDSGTIAYGVLAACNADGATGITQGTKDTFTGRQVLYLWKRALDAINELGAIASSYEWALRYVDGSPPTVYLDLKTALGSDVSASVFLEYGTGKANCGGYTRAESFEEAANLVWALGSGVVRDVMGNPLTARTTSDATSITAYGLYEDVLTFSDITVAALLDALAAAHVAVRKDPRVLFSLQPFPKTAPRFLTDWTIGDRVTARVVANSVTRTSGLARIWAADITIDDTGNEQATLALVPQ